MSHSCEKDQCSSCLWKKYHSCIYDSTQEQCEEKQDHQWCGSNGGSNGGSNNKQRSHFTDNTRKGSSSVQGYSTAPSCGSCDGCMLVSLGPATGCYKDWTQQICDSYSGYQWCGGNGPNPPDPGNPIYCCDTTTTPNPTCNTLYNTTTCPQKTSQVSTCSSCKAPPPTTSCVNPYYGSTGTPAGGLSSILTNDLSGMNKWLQIFPSLDPRAYAYQYSNCGSPDPANYRPIWGSGCFMYGQGGLNGLSAFLEAASKFPGFANGPDARKNLIELAIFFGNVSQETGDRTLGGLIFSKEGDSCQSSLFGKGPIQISYAINYQMATLGVNKPSDMNSLTSMAGPLTGACQMPAEYYNDLGDCWTQCANATPAQPPHGAGYNFCARPWLASGYNDTVSPPIQDPAPAWASAIWYWMNAPIAPSSAQFHNLQGDTSCATAHNMIQDPQYSCGDWCPVLAIAQVGCPTCCTMKTSTLDPQTVNRIGHFVEIAGILGLPEAQGSNADNLFCMLLNTCATGGGTAGSNTCPSGLSYQDWLATGIVPICGGVKKSLPAPPCVAVPNNTGGATDAMCKPCQIGSPYWPCPKPGLCQWASQ